MFPSNPVFQDILHALRNRLIYIMDHLSHLHPYAKQPCRFPLVYSTWIPYDKRGFFRFPERHFRGTPPTPHQMGARLGNYADLLQTWLFFGALHEFSRIFGVPLYFGEFIRYDEHGHRVITTAKLNSYIWYWIASEAHADQTERARKLREKRINLLLEMVWMNITVFCELEENSDRQGHIVLIPIVAVYEMLSHVAAFVFPGNPYSRRRAMPKAIFKFAERCGWCRGELIFFHALGLSLSSLYLLSSTPKRYNRENHTSCTSTTCSAFQLDERVYETTHTRPGCKCSHHQQPAVGRRIAEILVAGSVPSIAVRSEEGGSNSLTIDVFDTAETPVSMRSLPSLNLHSLTRSLRSM